MSHQMVTANTQFSANSHLQDGRVSAPLASHRLDLRGDGIVVSPAGFGALCTVQPVAIRRSGGASPPSSSVQQFAVFVLVFAQK